MSLAPGPPRQATGPPRSDAGVGIGILKGLVMSWESKRFKKWILQKYRESTRIPKIQKVNLRKITRFHADPQLWTNGDTFSNICLIQ